MSREPDSRERSLEESLARVHDALERSNRAAPAKSGAPVTPARSTPVAAIGASALARLDSEKAVLEARIAATQDEPVRRSLQGAVGAIAEQKRQRELLQRGADRLDAEFTRLAWTIEGTITQMVRLHSAAPEPGAVADPELEKSLLQLHQEIDAIAEALEHVSSGSDEPIPAPMAAIDESVAGPSGEEPTSAGRLRQRDR